jgi:hypothetical protein
MTPPETQIALALANCSFLPATWDKRFCRGLGEQARNKPDHPLSEAQRAHLLRLSHKYRRQLPTKIIMAAHDEMERAAFNRVESGKGALPDFTPVRRRQSLKRRAKAERQLREQPTLPLFDHANTISPL